MKNPVKEFIDEYGFASCLSVIVGLVLHSFYQTILSNVFDMITGGINLNDKYFVMAGNVREGATLTEAYESGVALMPYGIFISTIGYLMVLAGIAWLSLRFFKFITSRYGHRSD